MKPLLKTSIIVALSAASLYAAVTFTPLGEMIFGSEDLVIVDHESLPVEHVFADTEPIVIVPSIENSTFTDITPPESTMPILQLGWNKEGKWLDHMEGWPVFATQIDRGNPDAKYFDAKPRIQENPKNHGGIFMFDYQINQHIQIGSYRGDVLYKVNSNDNSKYFTAIDLKNSQFGEALNQLPASYKPHFMIINRDNEFLFYAKHSEEGLICIKMSHDRTMSEIISEDYMAISQILGSVKDIPQPEKSSDPNLDRIRGKFTNASGQEKIADLWLSIDEAQVATGVPLMGFGVGIMKDFYQNKQRYLIASIFDEASFQLNHINAIEPWGVNTSGYRLIDFNVISSIGKAQIQNLMEEATQLGNELMTLQTNYRSCPSGTSGNSCRTLIQNRMDEIKTLMEDMAKEYTKNHLPPIE